MSGPGPARARLPKRPNATACDNCKSKKVRDYQSPFKCQHIGPLLNYVHYELTIFMRQLKCIGDTSFACERCTGLGVDCVRTQPEGATIRQPYPQSMEELGSTTNRDAEAVSEHEGHGSLRPPMSRQVNPLANLSVAASTQPIESLSLGEFPDTRELKRLLQLYFSSIHRKSFRWPRSSEA